MRVKKSLLVGQIALGLVVCSLFGASLVRAEEDKKGSFWDNTKVTGQLNTSYNYNFNNPAETPVAVAPVVGSTAGFNSGVNTLRVFDYRHNSFDFNLAEINIENAPNKWAKFYLSFNLGQDVTVVDSVKGGGIGIDEFGVRQAYAELTAPVGNGLDFKIGHFVTLLGYEVIESSANLNTSRSFLFGFAIPFTHTGVLMTYPWNDKWSTTLGVVNGWDVISDNNKAKTIIGQIVYKPMDTLSLSLQGTMGPEQNHAEGNWRNVMDFVANWTPVPEFTLGVNYDLGIERGGVGCNPGVWGCWQGGALYLHYKPFEKVGFTVRGEYFHDHGSRTGVANLDIGEGTGTVHFYLGDGWETRLEFRHDQADTAIFAKANGTTRKFQDTISTEIVYAF